MQSWNSENSIYRTCCGSLHVKRAPIIIGVIEILLACVQLGIFIAVVIALTEDELKSKYLPLFGGWSVFCILLGVYLIVSGIILNKYMIIGGMLLEVCNIAILIALVAGTFLEFHFFDKNSKEESRPYKELASKTAVQNILRIMVAVFMVKIVERVWFFTMLSATLSYARDKARAEKN